jgi:hypothetical protein
MIHYNSLTDRTKGIVGNLTLSGISSGEFDKGVFLRLGDEEYIIEYK